MASIREYSRLFDAVSNGEFGKEAQVALYGTALGIQSGIPGEDHLEKQAVTSVVQESDEDSRKRRLAELLKKREHSGTAAGSATPNPPKGE